MPVSAVSAFAVLGVQARLVELVCRPSAGPPSIRLRGISPRAANRLGDDVRSALIAAGYNFPAKRIVIDPRPASGATTPQSVGLAAALGVLAATGQRDHAFGHEWAVHARLGPDGSIAPLPGTLAVAEAAARAGVRLIVARQNAAEAALVKGLCVAAVADLASAVDVFFGDEAPPDPPSETPTPAPAEPPIFPVAHLWRNDALTLACAGSHSLLITGVTPEWWASPVGASVAGLLPDLTAEEEREIVRIQSIAGASTTLRPRRPVRIPHPRQPLAELLGGGKDLAPGEASLAHNGVLMLDRLTAFPRATLAAIRAAHEDRHVVVHRDGMTVRLPTRFLLVAAMASCPAVCGRDCTCPPSLVAEHRAKLAPLAGCFDIHVHAAPVHRQRPWLSAAEMRAITARIRGAHERQRARRSAVPRGRAIGDAPDGRDLDVDPVVRKRAQALAQAAGQGPGHILRLARTFADVSMMDRVTLDCLYAALAFVNPRW